MSENGQRPQCAAITRAGQRCRLPAPADGAFCHIHAGQTPPALDSAGGVRQEVRRALRDLAARVEGDKSGRRGLRPFTAAEVTALLQSQMQRLPPTLQAGLQALIAENAAGEWLDAETWRGVGYVLQIALDEQTTFLRRRLRGEYEVDAWGYDPEIADFLALIAGVFFHTYWRVEFTGVEHIPGQGRCLLAANQSGLLPVDGAMIAYGVRAQHPQRRLVRVLAPLWRPTLPFWTMIWQKAGHTPAHPDTARQLLAADSLVLAFPEGYGGMGKLFRERYRVRRFDGEAAGVGFVRVALEMGAAILPVSVVGGEETYPVLADVKPLARLLGLPHFPITTTWPWLGPLGAIPLPSKWLIDIGPALPVGVDAQERSRDPRFVNEIAELLRGRIQAQIDQRLRTRASVFNG